MKFWNASWHIGTFWGIKLRLHWSMLLVGIYVIPVGLSFNGESLIIFLTTILLVFSSIALHEFGHAWMAARFGIATRQIVLILFGGFAHFDRAANKAWHEFLIAFAGPLVNLLIAGIIFIIQGIFALIYGPYWITELYYLSDSHWPPFLVAALSSIQFMNIVLGVLNLAPVYPLDGGRMLRAILQMGIGKAHANLVTLLISLPIAIGFVLYSGLRLQWVDIVIGLLILSGIATLSTRGSQWFMLAWSRLFDPGVYYCLCGKYEQAIGIFNEQIVRRPGNANTYYNRAIAHHQCKRYAESIDDYNTVLALQPDNMAARIGRAINLIMIGQTNQVETECEQFIQLFPNNPSAYSSCAQLFYFLGDHERAFAALEQGFKLAGNNADLLQTRGFLWHSLGNYAQAEQDFEAAVRCDSANPFALYNLGYSYAFNGNYKAAQANYQAALANKPDFAHVYIGRAIICIQQGNFIEALRLLDKAISMHPSNAISYFWRALVYSQQGQKELAHKDSINALEYAFTEREALIQNEPWLERYAPLLTAPLLSFYATILDQRPQSLLAFCGRGDIYRSIGRYDEALMEYNHAQALDPQSAHPYLGRAQVAYNQGNIEQCKAAIEQVVAHLSCYEIRLLEKC